MRGWPAGLIAAVALAVALDALGGEPDGVPAQLAQNVEPAYTPPTPAPPESPTFELRELNFSESALLDKADLDAIAKHYVGRELTLRDLQQIVAEVNALYQAKGMVTARALLPPQKIENGSVNVELVEGRLGAVEVTGNAYTRNGYILDRVPLEAGKVINGAKLDRDLKWFNRTNDASVNASLKPGAEYGQSDVTLAVDEPPKYVFRVFVDNEGVPSTGRNEAGISFQDNALLGHGDSFNFYGTHSSGADNGSVSYRIPVTQRGGAFALAYSNNTTAINAGPLEALDVTAKSTSLLASYTQPWIANETWLLNTPVTYSRTRSDTLISGIKLGQFRVEKGSVGLAFDVRDPRFRAAFAQNVAELKSTDLFDQETRNTVFNGNASAVVRINDDYYATGRAGWQYAIKDSLPPSDLFQLGGPGTVRGYDQGFVSGQQGYYAGLELHRQVTERANVFVFFDAGEVMTANFPSQSIQGTGLGVVFSWKNLTIDVAAGYALKDILPDQDTYRIDARAELAF